LGFSVYHIQENYLPVLSHEGIEKCKQFKKKEGKEQEGRKEKEPRRGSPSPPALQLATAAAVMLAERARTPCTEKLHRQAPLRVV